MEENKLNLKVRREYGSTWADETGYTPWGDKTEQII